MARLNQEHAKQVQKELDDGFRKNEEERKERLKADILELFSTGELVVKQCDCEGVSFYNDEGEHVECNSCYGTGIKVEEEYRRD